MNLGPVVALGSGVAAAALFSTLPWLGTRARAWMLAPHLGPPDGSVPGLGAEPGAGRDVLLAIGRAAARLGDRTSGILEPLPRRLDRLGLPVDPVAYRIRQGVAAVAVAALGAGLVLATGVPPVPGVVLLLGLPAAAVIAPEIELATRCRRWSTRTRRELPVVGEEIVAQLRAGRSATATLDVVADRRGTPLRQDLARVVEHLRAGGGLEEAMARWADRSDVDAVHRMARVLSLHHRTPDLAELVAQEVDGVRDELHRDLLADIDRRGQQVWIPVTVAALVPGAIFLLVPFFDALRLFGATG